MGLPSSVTTSRVSAWVGGCSSWGRPQKNPGMYGRPVHAVRCSVRAAGHGAAGPRTTRHCLLHRCGSERGRHLGRDQVGWAQQVVGPRLSPTSTVAFSAAGDATACVFSVWQLGLERRHCLVSQLLPKGTVGIPGPDPSLCGSCLPRAALLSRLEHGWLFKQEAMHLPGGPASMS